MASGKGYFTGIEPAGWLVSSNHLPALATMYLTGLAYLLKMRSSMLDLYSNHLSKSGFITLILGIGRKFPHNEVIPTLRRVEQ